jgi:hypothetical protein
MHRWLLALALIGCGGKTPEPIEMEEEEPEWAAEFAKRVAQACACEDDACVRFEHDKAQFVVDDHGGLEEAPPSVHAHTAELAVCFVRISHDLARDLGALADQVCGCTDSWCGDQFLAERERMTEKYGAVSHSGLLDADGADDRSRAAYHRMEACVADRTIAGARYAEMLRANTDQLCGCQDQTCSKQAIGALDDVYQQYYWVDADDSVQADIAAQNARYCECFSDALKRGFDVQLTSKISAFVTVDMDCR